MIDANEEARRVVAKFPQIESEVLQPFLRREIANAITRARADSGRWQMIGVVAIDRKTGKPSSGSHYTAGAKVYKSEPMARAAVRYKEESRGDEYDFVPAFIERKA